MKIYDSNEVTVVIAGIPVISGRGDEAGEFVSVEYLSDLFVDVVSVDGEVTRSKTNDLRADITLTIMSSSDSNILLSALMNADLLAANGAGVGPFLLKDNQGTSLYTAAQSWIVKPPKLSYGQKAVPLEWKIRCAKLLMVVGGN